jgi:hypothetical protein
MSLAEKQTAIQRISTNLAPLDQYQCPEYFASPPPPLVAAKPKMQLAGRFGHSLELCLDACAQQNKK